MNRDILSIIETVTTAFIHRGYDDAERINHGGCFDFAATAMELVRSRYPEKDCEVMEVSIPLRIGFR
jgi:hypothetical protein